jgi:hypothetical protein
MGDVAIAPPFLETEVKASAFDGVMAWIESPVITAAATSVDPSWTGRVPFRHTPKARDQLLSLLAFELRDAIDHGAAPGRLYIEALAAAFLIRIVKRHGLRAPKCGNGEFRQTIVGSPERSPIMSG